MEHTTTENTVKNDYENNPFLVGLHGLQLFFKLALPVAIITVVLAIVGLASSSLQQEQTQNNRLSRQELTPKQSYEEFREDLVLKKDYLEGKIEQNLLGFIVIVVLIIAALVFVGTILAGVFDYTAAQISRNKKVTFTEAFNAVVSRFFPYLWLRILVAIKIFLWSLLLVVPGIIMSVRYSLSGVSFFDKKLSANAATKDSSKIVKGAWLTTNGSFVLFNVITLGLINIVLKPGTGAVLYRQLDTYDKTGMKKPNAHPLSWLILILPYVFAAMLFLLIALALIVTYGDFN